MSMARASLSVAGNLRQQPAPDRREAAERFATRQAADMYTRVIIIAALLMGLVTLSSSPANALESAQDLVKACRAVDKKAAGTGGQLWIPNTKDALLCWGYMEAIQDLSVLADETGNRVLGACPPKGSTTLQLLRSFLRYAGAHPNALRGNSALVVIRALQEAFPCKTAARPDANPGANSGRSRDLG